MSSPGNLRNNIEVYRMKRWIILVTTAMILNSFVLLNSDIFAPNQSPRSSVETDPISKKETWSDTTETRGKHWSSQMVDNKDDVGSFTSLALDSDGNPHISYYNATGTNLVYTYLDGDNWVKMIADAQAGVGEWTSLDLDSSDRPHISYYDKTNGNLKYTYYTGAQWINSVVDSVGTVGLGTALKLDSTNKPHISYHDEGGGNLKYAKYNGAAWEITTVDTYGDVGEWPSMVLDSSDQPHVSYLQAFTVGAVTYWVLGYAHFNGAQWQNETADDFHGVGIFSSIDVDSNDRPHISYRDGTPEGYLRYIYHDGAQWNRGRVDSEGDCGMYTSIAVDSSDRPMITHRDGTGQNLRLAYFENDVWHTEIVDSMGDVGRYSSLVLDDDDIAYVSYTVGWKDEVRLAMRDTTFPVITSDNTMAYATTGDNFQFNISATDNDKVTTIAVNWKHKHLGSNLTLTKSGDYWTGGIRLGAWGNPLNYTVYVRDIAENIFISDPKSLEVRDNDPPVLQDDDSYILGTTGDLFMFDISAMDNVEVGSVKVNWNHGSLGANTSLVDMDGSWIGNITLDNESVSPLQYVIYVEDTSDGLYVSSMTNVTITDNDKPVLIELHHPTPPGTGNAFDIGVRVMDNIGVSSVRMKYKFDQLGLIETVLLPVTRGDDELWNTSLDIPSDVEIINTTFIIDDEKGNSLSTDWFPLDIVDDDAPEQVSDEPDGYPTTGDDFDIVAEFSDNNMVAKVNLSYTFDNITVKKTAMERGDGNSWAVTINISSSATHLFYSYHAEDEAGNIYETETIALPVRDDDPPVANGTDVEDDQGSTVTLDASNSYDNIGIVSYSWSFSYDEKTERLNGVSPDFEFEIAGEYTITLTVEDTSGKVGMDYVTVKIWDVEKPEIGAKVGGGEIGDGGSFETSAGFKVKLDASGSIDNVGIVNYQWSFTENGKEKKLQGRVKEYAFYEEGTYTITLTITDADNNSEILTFDVIVVDENAGEGGSFGMIMIIIIIVVIIAAAVIVVLMLMKRKGKSGKGKDELDEILSPTGQVPPPIYPASPENWQQQPAAPAAYPAYDQGAAESTPAAYPADQGVPPAQGGPPGPPPVGQLGPLPPIQ